MTTTPSAIKRAANAIERDAAVRQLGQTFRKQKIHASINVAGLGDVSNSVLPKGTSTEFFAVGIKQDGAPLGHTGPLSPSETTYRGSNQILSGEKDFVITRMGVRLHHTNNSRFNELAERYAWLSRNDGEGQFVELGPLWMFPCADFGVNSPAVAANPNTDRSYERNGFVPAAKFEPGEEIVIRANSKLGFNLNWSSECLLTTDGEEPGGDNLFSGEQLVTLYLEGYLRGPTQLK